ncbi:MAG: carbohydrate ABC transporter substrate-binding protein [Ktedonobacteraceae bacterium]|nr:carbohydrate ABC transporter substrate-binding protein [Ktedonobacteraceae bacterium]MBO0794660.1 carbohydrate ABC transporter substrate-binding protein [Ktedonobacteraceae bacterium]
MFIFDRRRRQDLDNLVEEYTVHSTVTRREFLQRATATGLSLSAATALLAACGGPGGSTGPTTSGTPQKVSSIDVLVEYGGSELDSFNAINAAFKQKTGITVKPESTRDLPTVLNTRVRGNNPPDICGMPTLDLFHSMADQGKVVPLDGFIDMNKYKQDYSQAWIDLASWKGKLYAVLPKANGKTTIWYNPKTFEAAGGTVPQTWDEMIALSDKLAKSGKYPWSLGVESAASSGWPAADWISEIYMNKYGHDMYLKWVKHEIPWTDPSIKDAIQMFGKIAQGNHYVNGAPKSILTTNFQNSTYAPYTSPPQAYMCYLGDFAAGFITSQFKNLKPGTDYNFFNFPTINPQYKGAITGGADIVVAMKDNDGTRQYMQYLATAEAQTIWVKRGGSTAVNKSVNLSDYPDDVSRQSAQVLSAATAVELSVGDLVPSSLQSAYWKGLLQYIQHPDQLDSILSSLESSAKSAYQS